MGAGIAVADLGSLTELAYGATNSITLENSLPGADDWDLEWVDESIEGFALPYSSNVGETVRFKIRTASTHYRISIYRVGWYGGKGARLIATINPSATLPQTQPDPITDTVTGLVHCDNWAVSASWAVPANAASGVYVANFEPLDYTSVGNRCMFVVRNDGTTSDILLQTSDSTYQAYNTWGGYSLYRGPAYYGRATKVSYHRPVQPAEIESDFFYGEYPLVRWLERNGYDVSYTSCIDTDRRPAELTRHKVFISSGHDEYWSGGMRANIEAARETGVNLVFMTGNEVFWRTRWEAASDGTPYGTLVCYKESLENAKTDPSPEWTGTWRDPRFCPPGRGGGVPENSLTGTLFRAINPIDDADFAIEVPAQFARLRCWRNTAVAALAPGQVRVLSPATLGYEWDADVDNGYRPAGLVRMSETTQVAAQVLQDYAGTYIEAPLTHAMAMYRAPSGALVWSTGTVQWAWGLDEYHRNRPDAAVPTDVNMQQLTLNVLADMGVLAASRQLGLAAATKSTDTIAPVSTITAPTAGSVVPIGTPVVVSGTAVDTGGGVVAAVEVSIDGGDSWHPATGTGAWSYTFTPMQLGSFTVRSRAVDDSCNLEVPGPRRVLQGGPRTTPCSIWDDSVVPAIAAFADNTPLELGVKFRADADGFIRGIRFYKGLGNGGVHIGKLYRSNGVLLGSVEFTDETATGWQTATFASPIAVRAGTTYVASYWAPQGRYSGDVGYFATARDFPPLRALATGDDGANGVFRVGGGFPNQTYGATNYWVDVVYHTDNDSAPTVASRQPAAGVTSVASDTTVSCRFSEPIVASSIVMTIATSDGVDVIGTVSYDPAERTARFTPGGALADATTYVATVSGATDYSGSTIEAPVSWEFTTAGLPGTLPTSIWTSADVPAAASSSDTSAVELGLRFRSDVAGFVTAVRYYRGGGNSGNHVGRVWALDGTLLGTATFDAEGDEGWQQAPLDPAVEIDAGATYVVSYLAPNGGYAADGGMFGSSGVTRGPLRALSAGEAGGGNGVFRYGAEGGFPTASWGNANYWVDLVFDVPPDEVAPTVANVIPAPDLVAVAPTEPVVVTFDEPVDPSSIEFGLVGPGHAPIAGDLTWTDARSVEFRPAVALAAGTRYTATVAAVDVAGNAMAEPVVWSFTTAVAPGHYPVTIWTTSAVPAVAAADDPSAIEVGMKFGVDVAGAIVGIRYYKGLGNVGPHTARLWASDGQLLGSVVAGTETALGWQQAWFDAPIPVQPGQWYVASYHTPTGRYSVTGGGLSSAVVSPPLRALASATVGGNGVYRYGAGGFPDGSYADSNYFVDVLFTDLAAPTVTGRVPEAGAVGVSTATSLVVTFSEPIADGTLRAELRDGAGVTVPVTVDHDPGSAEATIRPIGPLASATTYTASVLEAADLAGNALSDPSTWSFTTVDSSLSSLFGDAVPATPAANDPSMVEVGMKFQVTQYAQVEGIRYYRGPGNDGIHVGHLWDSVGGLLADVTFQDESAGGWQYAPLAQPVVVQPGTVYVVSYVAPQGRYAVSGGFFNAGPVSSGPIVGLANVAGDGNGVFAYGGGFPTGTYGGGNYWVDVVVRTT